MGLTTEVTGEFYDNDQVGPFTITGWVHPSSVAADKKTIFIESVVEGSTMHYKSYDLNGSIRSGSVGDLSKCQ